MGAAQAMFFSFFASLRNWRAFAVYGIVIALAGLMVSLGGDRSGHSHAWQCGRLRAGMLVLMIALLPTIFASFITVTDIFQDDPEPPPITLADLPAEV